MDPSVSHTLGCEIEVFRTLEIGEAKWCKEHIPRQGKDLTDEGLLLLDDLELWWEKQNPLWSCHNSRKIGAICRLVT